jgi:hypothetical protein
MNRFKMKQYTSLLKQILKGLAIDAEDIEGGFEEMLEYGSKVVLQMRKQQREEESNRRRNNRRG